MHIPLIPKTEWTAKMKAEDEALQKYFYHLLEPWNRDLLSHLHHYTGADTLNKILVSRTIRLYSVFEMADDEEFRYPMRVIWESIQPYWGDLIIELSDLFNPGRPVTLEDAMYAFAACFCEAEESEFMWRNYGDCFRGASIKIKLPSFYATPERHAVYPMVYDGVALKEILSQFFDYVVKRDWMTRFNFEQGRSLALEPCLLLLHFLVRMKRESFRPECEWRALKLGWTGDANEKDDRGHHFVEIPLLPEYLSGIKLGSKCALRETDVAQLVTYSFGVNVPILRSKLD